MKLGFETNLDVGYKYQSNKAGTDVEGSWAAGSGGSSSLVLSAGAEAKAGDWVSVELIGESKGTIIFSPVIDNGNNPCLDLNYKIQPLIARVKIDMGGTQGIRYTESWQIVDSTSGNLAHWELRNLME